MKVVYPTHRRHWATFGEELLTHAAIIDHTTSVLTPIFAPEAGTVVEASKLPGALGSLRLISTDGKREHLLDRLEFLGVVKDQRIEAGEPVGTVRRQWRWELRNVGGSREYPLEWATVERAVDPDETRAAKKPFPVGAVLLGVGAFLLGLKVAKVF